MGQGGRRGHRPAGGGCGAQERGDVPDSARWLLGWLSLVGPRLAARWLPAGAGACSVCAPERECAGGDAGETLLFPLLLLGRSLSPPRLRPAPPGTLGSVVPAFSSATSSGRGPGTRY